ncbi:MAG TPA: carboxypeptidase-like regulatory domain-containing protein, partial [Longimicrobiales bacterium]|nr:carboxypeptidase-like regulatory domain-containing protein [Longimicrobiales bacterium]
MKHLFIAVAALSFVTASAAAQQPAAPGRAPGSPPAAGPGEIRGSLVDAESNAAISSASVSVRNSESVLVSGAIANPDGTFRVDGLQPGTYTLRYTMIGYATENSQPVTISAASPRV